jgi:hypothetical protein
MFKLCHAVTVYVFGLKMSLKTINKYGGGGGALKKTTLQLFKLRDTLEFKHFLTSLELVLGFTLKNGKPILVTFKPFLLGKTNKEIFTELCSIGKTISLSNDQ